jgi:hypothetical protein
MDQWIPLKNQHDKDIWLHVKAPVEELLKSFPPRLRFSSIKKDLKTIDYLLDKGLKV